MKTISKQLKTLQFIGVFSLAVLGGAAQAGETGTILDIPADICDINYKAPAVIATPTNVSANTSTPFDSGLTTEDLEGTRGMGGVIVSEQQAVVTQNSMNGNFNTGNNAISGNAFQNANGPVISIQNTGSQSVVQGSMIINMDLN